jgi:hypothetical protein
MHRMDGRTAHDGSIHINLGRTTMSRLATAFVACLLTAAALPASAQAPAAPAAPPPLFSTTKVDGTDGV